MLFGRRKPGYTTTVDSSVDPEQAVPVERVYYEVDILR